MFGAVRERTFVLIERELDDEIVRRARGAWVRAFLVVVVVVVVVLFDEPFCVPDARDGFDDGVGGGGGAEDVDEAEEGGHGDEGLVGDGEVRGLFGWSSG